MLNNVIRLKPGKPRARVSSFNTNGGDIDF